MSKTRGFQKRHLCLYLSVEIVKVCEIVFRRFLIFYLYRFLIAIKYNPIINLREGAQNPIVICTPWNSISIHWNSKSSKIWPQNDLGSYKNDLGPRNRPVTAKNPNGGQINNCIVFSIFYFIDLNWVKLSYLCN